jgi:hypothetical protein
MDASEQLLHFRDGEIRAETLARLTDCDVEMLGEFVAEMRQKKDGTRTVGRLLESIYCREVHRRRSDGSVELASFMIPSYQPGELMRAVNNLTALTYSKNSEPIASLFDELHSALMDQVNAFLVLLQRQIEARASQ